MSSDAYRHLIESVERAQNAVIKAQGLNDPENLQRAEYELALSKQYLRGIEDQANREGNKYNEIHRAKELIKHLSEAYESIRAY